MKNTNENLSNSKKTPKFKIGEPCVLDPDMPCIGCKECLMCDLNPEKYCDNCGQCLDSYNTDDKGYVSIKVDKIITDGEAEQDINSTVSLEDLFKQYGLDGDDE